MHFIWFLIIGIIAGWLAGKVVNGGGFGLIGDLVVGVIGAYIGGFLFQLMGIDQSGGTIASLVTATFGAILLIAVLRFIRR